MEPPFSLVSELLGDRSGENGAVLTCSKTVCAASVLAGASIPYNQALSPITSEAVAAHLARSVPAFGEGDQRPGLAVIVIGGARQRLANGQ